MLLILTCAACRRRRACMPGRLCQRCFAGLELDRLDRLAAEPVPA